MKKFKIIIGRKTPDRKRVLLAASQKKKNYIYI